MVTALVAAILARSLFCSPRSLTTSSIFQYQSQNDRSAKNTMAPTNTSSSEIHRNSFTAHLQPDTLPCIRVKRQAFPRHSGLRVAQDARLRPRIRPVFLRVGKGLYCVRFGTTVQTNLICYYLSFSISIFTNEAYSVFLCSVLALSLHH